MKNVYEMNVKEVLRENMEYYKEFLVENEHTNIVVKDYSDNIIIETTEWLKQQDVSEIYYIDDMNVVLMLQDGTDLDISIL